jgi:aspartyl-tRNA(Asn)/glutamyl-tRNA(Gln) amidotransferase subunit A
VGDPADLGVVEAAGRLARRDLSAVELAEAFLRRIRERDGTHSHDGDAGSVNAWVRVYEEDALAAAARADEQLRAGGAPLLCGIPIGLKDLYAVAGKPLTASSRALDVVPARDCEAWARLAAAGMVLLGHVHTHEFAVGGTTDQVGNPWALERSAGGSSGGSAAALAARTTPAATGTDTAGSLRIPSALSGTSTVKPTRGRVSLRGIVPLAPSLDHAGPMARTLVDCAALLAAMAGPDGGRPWSFAAPPFTRGLPAPRTGRPLAGVRLALSARLGSTPIDDEVAAGFATALDALRELGGELVEPAQPDTSLDLGRDFIDVLGAELRACHRRFDHRRALYRPSIREWLEQADARALTGVEYAAAQDRRREVTAAWTDWLDAERIAAIVEPTVAVTAPIRGDGYEHAGTDAVLVALTHYWDWTGFPVVALPSGVGASSGLPVSVSLIGPPGRDWELLQIGVDLQERLGLPEPPVTGP